MPKTLTLRLDDEVYQLLSRTPHLLSLTHLQPDLLIPLGTDLLQHG